MHTSQQHHVDFKPTSGWGTKYSPLTTTV